MKYSRFHADFKLNNNSFSTSNEIVAYAATLSEVIAHFLNDWFSTNDFIEVQTSGSTGNPKIIQLKKEFVKNSAQATGLFFNLQEKTLALLCMPINYIAGKMMLVRALELGWHIDIVEPALNPLKGIEKAYDFSAMVPLQLENSLAEIHKIKKLIVGGGVVSNELEKKLQVVSTEVFATFGMTETITHIAAKKINSKCHSKRSEEAYRTLPNVAISNDDRSCLVIHAPKVSVKEIVTNDVVEIVSENAFKWLGRYDNVINSGGIKLHPESIEKKLSNIIVERFFVAGIPDKNLGEKLILIIENDTATSSEEASVIKEIKKKLQEIDSLTKYEVPKQIYITKKFVETATKKIHRKNTLELLQFN
ncbi:MAG: AMP-binding protein [Flavobacteriaceae bacterium]|nr:AMP-binding protein [Flavobacteriaceae bacterium]